MKGTLRASLAMTAGALALALAVPNATLAAEDWYPFPVEVWDPPFDMASPRTTEDYVPLDKAAKKWDICVSFPHMKDAYWMAVNYGVVEESKRLGVKMQLVEAGGYTNLNKQLSQIEDCVAGGAEAVVIGAISFDGLNNLVKEIRSKGVPVIDVINGMSSADLSAKSLVSFGEMGYKAGEYIAKNHPKGSGTVKVAWFPGPPGAGWVEAGTRASQRRSPRATSRSSPPSTATRARKSSSSWSRTPSRPIRTSTTSPGPRRPPRPPCSCCATAACRTRSRFSPITSRRASTRTSSAAG